MKFTELIKGSDSEGREKHVPTIVVEKAAETEGTSVVRVVVGDEVAHPNTKDHFIQWAELYGQRRDSGQVILLGRTLWTPEYSNPSVHWEINNLEEFVSLAAMTYCNLHGVWANTVEV